MYLMPYAPFAYRERNVSDSLDEHVLVVGSLDGLELGRPYFPMVLLCERAPNDGYIATGIDKHWYRSASILEWVSPESLSDRAMHTGQECSPIGHLRRSSCLFSALESFRQAQSRCPGAPHPQQVPFLGGISSVGRCPVAPVVARGGAVLGVGAVVVELLASVS